MLECPELYVPGPEGEDRSSSSESLELFSLLEDEVLLESDELSQLLIWSIRLASAFSSERRNIGKISNMKKHSNM